MHAIGIPGLALRNLRRKVARTVVLLILVAVVTGTLLGATIFITGMRTALKIGTYRLGADVLVVPEKNEAQAKSALLAGEPTAFYMDRAVLEQVSRVEGVRKATAQLFLKPTTFTCCYNVDAFLIAFDPATDFTITPWLQRRLKKPLQDDEIITGNNLPVVSGDLLPFFGTPFTVAGTMEPTGMKFFDQSVFMTMDAAYAMAANSRSKAMQPLDLEKNRISAVLVQTAEGFTPGRVAIRIEHAVDGVKAIASDEVISTVRRQLAGLLKGIVIISAIVWVLALLMTGFAFYMIVNERQRELGLLRAMGAKRRQVALLIITEAMFLSLAGGLVGIAAGGSVLYFVKGLIVSGLKLPYLLPSAVVLVELSSAALLFSLLSGVMAALFPAAHAGRMEPYEAIRKGE